MKIFSVNFKIVAPEDAVVPVMDRGYLYGDSIYEVVRTYRKSIPFLMERHYARLRRSAERIRLQIPFSCKKLADHIVECVARANHPDSYVRIIVSRGADDRFDLTPDRPLQPNTVMVVDHVHTYPRSYFTEGINIQLVSIRRNLRTALDPNIKSGNYMNNMLAIMEAKEKGALDAVMLNHKDCVTEGTTSNVFIVSGGRIVTPAVESGLLEGLSRALLKEIMDREKISYEEREIPREEFLAAQEIFLTGTTKEVMPVTQVNGKPVGTGVPGEVTRSLMKLFGDEVMKILNAATS